MRRREIKTVYIVRGIDTKGVVQRTKFCVTYWRAHSYALKLSTYVKHLTPYIAKYSLTELGSDLLNQKKSLALEGIYTSRREAEIAVFGFSDIEEI